MIVVPLCLACGSMGRNAVKLSEKQKRAIVADALDNGRQLRRIATDGIPGVLDPGFVTETAIGNVVRIEREIRKRAQPGALEQAGERLLWDLHDECRKALERFRSRDNENDFRQLKGVADIATKLERAIAARPKTQGTRPSHTEGTETQPAEKPNTLADRLESGTNGNGKNASGAVQSDALAPKPVHAGAELLNHAAPHDAL
jgi:hypothetical protein